MYCKRKDTIASFMYSYSWCPSSDACVEDLWNDLNAWCEVGWKQGYTLDLVKDCGAVEEAQYCPRKLVSSPAQAGATFRNASASLPPGHMCTVQIDATKEAARFALTAGGYLGCEYDGYIVGNPYQTINVAVGDKVAIRIYNAEN